MNRMRKCNDEVYQLAKVQALVNILTSFLRGRLSYKTTFSLSPM